jgi:hypothetical protein
MADDYQSTLKGKIKILYQLEKWQDVIKLGEQYNEKYGKDVEIDMMRFKSERRLSKTAPAEENKARVTTQESKAQESSGSLAIPGIKVEEEPPLLLTADHEAVENPAMLVMNQIPSADQPRLVEEKLDDEPFELIITDSFDEDKPVFSQTINEPSPEAEELIVTGPYAENDPVFSLANNEPPVILAESGNAENVPIQIEPRAEEMAIVEESPSEFVNTKIAFDFKSNPAMVFDAEPTLTPPPSQGESIAIQINDEEKKLSAESLAPDSAVNAESAEAWDEKSVFTVKKIAPEPKIEPAAFQINEREKTIAAESFMEMADKKSQPVSEPYDDFLKKPKVPKKIAFNFKLILVLMLPLAAAVILWLALSGKINLDGGSAEKSSPAAVVEPPPPAVQRPAQKVNPAVQIPQTDEKDQLVNEKILQANNFIKNGDMLKALAVVLQAKKIKMTEPLRLLDELITKKIREDEARDAEQKKTEQSRVQSEGQVYANADTENTLAVWQNFLVLYPQGEFAARARKKIVVLEKKAAQKTEQELQLKIKLAQKLKLRSDYMDLSQAELNNALLQLGKLPAQFEQLEHGGEKVIIDFSSGLMWTLWKKPMAFDKAKWWANRIYAGYAGWRLPTVEESLSLLQMASALYTGLGDFAVWTGDGVSDQSRSIWALRLPQGQFTQENYDQVYYVWAVRKAGK